MKKIISTILSICFMMSITHVTVSAEEKFEITGVNADVNSIVLDLSAELDTVPQGTIFLSGEGNKIDVEYNLCNNGNKMTIIPEEKLECEKKYNLVILQGFGTDTCVLEKTYITSFLFKSLYSDGFSDSAAGTELNTSGTTPLWKRNTNTSGTYTENGINFKAKNDKGSAVYHKNVTSVFNWHDDYTLSFDWKYLSDECNMKFITLAQNLNYNGKGKAAGVCFTKNNVTLQTQNGEEIISDIDNELYFEKDKKYNIKIEVDFAEEADEQSVIRLYIDGNYICELNFDFETVKNYSAFQSNETGCENEVSNLKVVKFEPQKIDDMNLNITKFSITKNGIKMDLSGEVIASPIEKTGYTMNLYENDEIINAEIGYGEDGKSLIIIPENGIDILRRYRVEINGEITNGINTITVNTPENNEFSFIDDEEKTIEINSYEVFGDVVIIQLSKPINNGMIDNCISYKEAGLEKSFITKVYEDGQTVAILPAENVIPGKRIDIFVKSGFIDEDKILLYDKVISYVNIPNLYGTSGKDGNSWKLTRQTNGGGNGTCDSDGKNGYTVNITSVGNGEAALYAPDSLKNGTENFTFSYDITRLSDNFMVYVVLKNQAEGLYHYTYGSKTTSLVLKSDTAGLAVNTDSPKYTTYKNIGIDKIEKEQTIHVDMILSGENIKIFIDGKKIFDENGIPENAGTGVFGFSQVETVKIDNIKTINTEKCEYITSNVSDNFDVGGAVEIGFDNKLNTASLNEDSFVVYDENKEKANVKYSLSEDKKTVIINPKNDFDYRKRYTLSIDESITYEDGQKNGKFVGVDFITCGKPFELETFDIFSNGKKINTMEEAVESVSFKVKLNNNSSREVKEGLISAVLYKINEIETEEMVDIKIKPYSLIEGQNEIFEAELKKDQNSGEKYKLILYILDKNNNLFTEFRREFK